MHPAWLPLLTDVILAKLGIALQSFSKEKWENRGKMTKLCKNDNFEGFFKGNLEANLGTHDPF